MSTSSWKAAEHYVEVAYRQRRLGFKMRWAIDDRNKEPRLERTKEPLLVARGEG